MNKNELRKYVDSLSLKTASVHMIHDPASQKEAMKCVNQKSRNKRAIQSIILIEHQ